MFSKRKALGKYLFALFLLVLTAVFAVMNSRVFSLAKKYSVNLNPTSTVLIGDSHACYGIDPEYIANSINIAQESENIIYTYFVLKKILADSSGIKNVVVSFSYHSIGSPFAYFEANEMLRRYHLLFPKDFYFEMCRNEGFSSPYIVRLLIDHYHLPLGLVNAFYDYHLQTSKEITDIPYIGHYLKQHESRIGNEKILKDAIYRHFIFKGKPVRVSGFKISYLKKIINLCESKKIRLYIVTLPVHPDYFNKIPQNMVRDFDHFLANLQRTFNIKYINFSRMDLPSNHYYDYDHLNYLGARVCSTIINRVIKLKPAN